MHRQSKVQPQKTSIMATLISLQALPIKQILNGTDDVPSRLSRPKRAKKEAVQKQPTAQEDCKPKQVSTNTQPAQPQVIEVAPKVVNYGEEGETVEFKTSFFFKDGQIKETEQACAVAKEVCAFLNSNGGIVYIGVRDDGSLSGVADDITYLSRNKALYYARQGKTFTYSGKDGYKRWVALILRKKIELVKKYSIDIKVDYDQHGVLVITVPKGQQDVAIMDNGNAYVRRNSECILLSQEAIEDLRKERKNESIMPEHEKKAKELAAIARNAIRGKKKVLLHNYCSNNSQKISDRLLEIFECSPNNEYVYAYEEASGLVKQFKLCRAGSIEILDKSWEYESKHSRQERDVFNMTRSKESESEKVEIEMTLRAKTLLEEEYPEAKRDLHPISPTQWVLDTTVANMIGVGRFCAGLLDEIRIVRGDMLRGYITNYILRQAYQYCF